MIIALSLSQALLEPAPLRAQEQSEFRIPREAEILRTYGPDDVHYVAPEEFRTRYGRDLAYDPSYLPAIDAIPDAIAAGMAGRPTPQVAVGPAIGSDAGTLARIARGARVLVGIDLYPAADAKRITTEPLYYTRASGERWRHYSVERDEIFRLEQTLGALHEAVPGFQLRQVVVFHTRIPVGTHILVKYLDAAGRSCEYVQVQGNISNKALTWGFDGRVVWWLKELDRLQPRMIVVKGAQDHLHPESEEVQQIRAHFLNWIESKDAVLVEDNSPNERRTMEFSGSLPMRGSHYMDIENLPFGYEARYDRWGRIAGNKARIHFMGPHIPLVCPGAFCNCLEREYLKSIGIDSVPTGLAN